jgi:DNA replication protein DnaC
MWRDAIADEAQQRWSLINAFEQSLRYALYPKGWLLISWPHGVGNSHLAGAIIRRMLEAEWTARYLPAPDLRGRYIGADDPVWLEE